MCGRFAIYSSLQDLFKYIRYINDPDEYDIRYNASPTNILPVFRRNDEGVVLGNLRWGLIPFWSKDDTIGGKLINARSESAGDKPSFRNAYRSRHCLIPANGFFEWRKNDKQPMYIFLKDHPIFCFAGLWENWKAPSGEYVRTFTILTTQPNEIMGDIHDRMPVILPPGKELEWFDCEGDIEASNAFMKPLDSGLMTYYPVSKLVNSPRNNTEAVTTPLGA